MRANIRGDTRKSTSPMNKIRYFHLITRDCSTGISLKKHQEIFMKLVKVVTGLLMTASVFFSVASQAQTTTPVSCTWQYVSNDNGYPWQNVVYGCFDANNTQVAAKYVTYEYGYPRSCQVQPASGYSWSGSCEQPVISKINASPAACGQKVVQACASQMNNPNLVNYMNTTCQPCGGIGNRTLDQNNASCSSQGGLVTVYCKSL